jgi:hypothetical protein
MTSTGARRRLHISPLTPATLSSVLGSALSSATNISYHETQTSPDSGYGYVDLPPMEAEKVIKRANGAIIKGKRIKIESAKPPKRKAHEADGNGEQPEKKSKSMKPSKSKPQPMKEMSGHELSPDRKVKRGWTEPTSRRDKKQKMSSGKTLRQKSKYSDKEELLFQTKLPPNRSDTVPDTKAKGKKRGSKTVVHEFENTTSQPSFLKQGSQSQQASLEYVDGQGWVNESGKVVEPEPSNMRARRNVKKASEPAKSATKPVAEELETPPEKEESKDATSFGEESDDSSTSSSSSSTSSTPSTPGQGEPPNEQPEVHPLEALFKKPQKPASLQDIAKPSLELATSNFSFFDSTTAEDDIEEEPSGPGTPYGSQDQRNRGLRSAAPTPDTAHPSRFNSYGSIGLPGDEDLSDGDDVQPESSKDLKSNSPQTQGKIEPSDFEKMFWEKRGDNNRAWKERRRTVLKENRRRENRSRKPKRW